MITVSLHVGARVYCQDEYCGDLHTVVMNRPKGRITDLIVEPTPTAASPTGESRGRLRIKGRAIPVALTDYVDDRGIHLRIDIDELQTYPEGVEGLTQPETATV
jgi:hypothetical protein